MRTGVAILALEQAFHQSDRFLVAQSVACRSAVMAGDRLSDREAIGLVDSLLKCENRYSCPHGRPTFIKMSREDLDKQFGRG